jgi:hypothetical protein
VGQVFNRRGELINHRTFVRQNTEVHNILDFDFNPQTFYNTFTNTITHEPGDVLHVRLNVNGECSTHLYWNIDGNRTTKEAVILDFNPPKDGYSDGDRIIFYIGENLEHTVIVEFDEFGEPQIIHEEGYNYEVDLKPFDIVSLTVLEPHNLHNNFPNHEIAHLISSEEQVIPVATPRY